MNVHLIKPDGSEDYAMAEFGQIRGLIGALCLDKVILGDGRIMFVNGTPLPETEPTNLLATDLCRQANALRKGCWVVGDAAIVREVEVECPR